MGQKIMCDYCKKSTALVDGKTCVGMWAYMCYRCFRRYGVGFGDGLGTILKQVEENECT